MDLDYVESLAELLAGSMVTELTVRRGDRSITVRRRSDSAEMAPAVAEPAAPGVALSGAVVPQPAAHTALVALHAEGHEVSEPRYELVRAHRVGIFHRGLAEGGEPLVRVGDPVAPRQQLASIESMRLFDEVDNPVSGRVVGVFVESGEAVEYGQPLFHIELCEVPEDVDEGDTP